MSARRPLIAVLTAALRGAPALAVLGAPAPADAQLAPAGPSCLDSIPAAALKRIPVYVAAEPVFADGATRGSLASMDVLTQAVAEHARALLGAGPGQLPPGEPTITWRHLEHQVRVVSYRDGRISWRVEPPAWLSERSTADSAA